MPIIDDDPRKEYREHHWTDDYGWYRVRCFEDMLKWEKSLDDVDIKILTKLTERISRDSTQVRPILRYGGIRCITKEGWCIYRDMIINGKSLEDALRFSDRSHYENKDEG